MSLFKRKSRTPRRDVASEIAERVRAMGATAEIRPVVGGYRPELLIESVSGDFMLHFDRAEEEGQNLHFATIAWIATVCALAYRLRGKVYTPVLVSNRKLRGATARYAFDTKVLYVNADPDDPATAEEVAGYTLGFRSDDA